MAHLRLLSPEALSSLSLQDATLPDFHLSSLLLLLSLLAENSSTHRLTLELSSGTSSLPRVRHSLPWEFIQSRDLKYHLHTENTHIYISGLGFYPEVIYPTPS